MAVVTAIAVTALLALGSFILSFSALWDIATEIWPQRELSWIAPVIVDGTILQATISLVAAAGDESRRLRQFFWFLLITAAAISIAGNALHAYISETARLDPMVAVIGGTIPPAFLLLSTHGLVLLLRLRPEPAAPSVQEVGDHLETDRREIAQADYSDPVDARTVGDFVEPARRLREVTNATTEPSTIARILWLNHSQPHQTRRALAKAVNVHHGTVSRILDAWGEHRDDIDGADEEQARQPAMV
ncbi:DUF2637 domain-containing protein [Williamsia muralis]|uniref:DUF2637 domain-containing protein n=1 Tax=Williamsia marianensis TaxID=85044 RepID=UPI0037F47322